MWTTIKNDPIIKAIVVIILGVLGFGFAFNVMFGQRNVMDGGEMSGGYLFGNNLSYWLVVALKLLMIVLVIFAVVTIIKLIGGYLINGEQASVNRSEKNASLVKSLAVVALAVLAIVLLFAVFGGYLGYGSGFNLSGNHMPGNYYNNDGARAWNYGNPGIASILAVLLKITLYVSFFGLIVGLGVFLYKSLSRGAAQKVQPESPRAVGLTNCPVCKGSISSEFAFCPICGAKV